MRKKNKQMMVNSLYPKKISIPTVHILVVRLSNRLEELRVKRIELEANRVLVVRRIQRLQTQIAIRRREGKERSFISMNLNFVLEKDLWKKKYLMEKNQNALIDEQNHSLSVIISNLKFFNVILFM
jgi:hypothetical protein